MWSSKPEVRKGCPMPPYNATNFNSDSPIFTTLQTYAGTAPFYPLQPGTDAKQLLLYQQSAFLVNAMNNKTTDMKELDMQLPYPRFKSHAELLSYRQGLRYASARNLMTGENPSEPAGIPCSTIYDIIHSE